MPFMDTILASVVALFGRVGGNGGRAVLRAAVGKVLPRQIVRRKKVGSPFSIGEWFRGPYRDLFRDAGARRSSLAGIISRPQLRTCKRSTLPDDRIAKNNLVVDEPRDVLRTFKLTACMPAEAVTARLAPWMACIYLSNQHGTSEPISSAAPFLLEDHYRAAEAWEPAPRLECPMIAALRWRDSDQNHCEGA